MKLEYEQRKLEFNKENGDISKVEVEIKGLKGDIQERQR